MTRLYGVFLLCAFLCAIQASVGNAQSAASPETGPGTLRSTHGSWQVRCGRIETAPRENCVAIQVVKSPIKNAGLTAIILRANDNHSFMLRIVAPLGILVETAVNVRADDRPFGRQKVIRCLTNGCVTESLLDQAALNRLRNAKKLTMDVHETLSDTVSFTLPTDGLADALSKL